MKRLTSSRLSYDKTVCRIEKVQKEKIKYACLSSKMSHRLVHAVGQDPV
jgi:hypothetical protein